MISNFLVRPHAASPSYGGKANNLLLLEQMGCVVPAWAVVPQEVMTSLIGNNAFTQLSSATEFELDNIFTELPSLFGPQCQSLKYAVRSSAAGEDGEEHSFAGQFDTLLDVAHADIPSAIVQVWRSTVSDHVLEYKKFMGIEENIATAVIIQVMVASDYSGVAFGIDPVTGQTDKKVISAVKGLGEGLVSGKLNGDNFWIQGTEVTSIDDTSTLNHKQLLEIGVLLDRLEQKTGLPQDVEFAYVGDQLYVLQTRPVTTVTDRGEYTLWDNSNIVESYPGVTTPMTFSFISKMYEAVYIQLCELLGVSSKSIQQNSDVFKNTLGLVRGRVYYNLANWYKMLALVPGFSINARYMETMMGVKEHFDLDDSYRMSIGKAWFRTLLMLVKMIGLHFSLDRERDKFQTSLDIKLKNYNAINYDQLPIAETIAHYKTYETTLVKEWKVPLVNDFFSMIWFGLLKKKAEQLLPDETNLHNDLLCGSKDIISVAPIYRTLDLSKLVSANGAAKELFENNSPHQIWEQLSLGQHPDIKKEIDRYLADFGERCTGELKLETVSYTQDPTLFVHILKQYVSNGLIKDNEQANVNEQLRIVAEEKIYTRLKGKPLKKWWLNMILSMARKLVSNRENLRYERTRAFGVVRKMTSGIGAQLYKNNIVEDAKDVFYLKLDELLAIEDNPNRTVVEKLYRRKATFEAYRQQPSPMERFYTYGHDFIDKHIYSEEKLDAIEGDLKGIGCCPGLVKAKVMVVHDPRTVDSLGGAILVTRCTDPGWVTLFPSASGIIVERGSLLSHSAIVAREMGIPCIVSVDALLRTLNTGDEIIMNGSTGLIQLI